MGEGPFVAGISLMWRALVFVTAPNYFGSQMKVTDETALWCMVVLCPQDEWWVRDLADLILPI